MYCVGIHKHSFKTPSASLLTEKEVRKFIICKVESVANIESVSAVGVNGELYIKSIYKSLIEELDSFDNRAVSARFHQLFSLPGDERLVNCKSTELRFLLFAFTHLNFQITFRL